MTKQEIKKRYTRIEKGRLYLTIDNQEFQVWTSLLGAGWMRDRLVMALQKMIKDKEA